MKVKYVVINYHGDDTMIIFPGYIQHATMAKIGCVIISAGFVNMKTKACYGESVSLKVKSDPELDNILLEEFFNQE